MRSGDTFTTPEGLYSERSGEREEKGEGNRQGSDPHFSQFGLFLIQLTMTSSLSSIWLIRFLASLFCVTCGRRQTALFYSSFPSNHG